MMMRNKLKVILVITAALIVPLTCIWIARLVWFRPFSIDDFFERAYLELLQHDPEALTQTGSDGSFWMKGYRAQLTDVSPRQTYSVAETGKEVLATLERYKVEDLTGPQQISYRVFHWFLKTHVDSEPFLFHDYPITHISGAHIEIPVFMNSLPLRSKNDIDNYLERLEKIDDKFGTVIDAMEERRKRQIIPPTHILQKAIAICEEFYQIPVDENPMVKSFERKLMEIAFLEPLKCEARIRECKRIVKDEVIPAYRRLAQYLLQVESGSMAIAGVWHLPDGDAYYRNCLLRETTLPLDPDSLYLVGKKELERINEALRLLKPQTGNSTRTFASDSAGRTALLEHFRSTYTKMTPELPSFFRTIPLTPLDVAEVPAHRMQQTALAFYVVPRGNPLSHGKTYVNTWRSDALTPMLATVYAYHEGIPGHHMQKAIQAELPGLPKFRRFLPFSAFEEGWAMYAERLGAEMMHDGSTEMNVALLRSELFRTARLLADIGIHHKKWLRDQAIRFLEENAELTETEAAHEVDRYIVRPGQGCTYMVGSVKFKELRERARSELSNFDIREFHDVLLGQGSIPLPLLEEQVEHYIRTKKN